MKNKNFLALTLMLSAVMAVPILANTRPFPQAQANRSDMAGTLIVPARTQALQNQDVVTRYNAFRTAHFRGQNTTRGLRVWVDATGTQGTNTATISEAHGYGMKILVLMAGAPGVTGNIQGVPAGTTEQQLFDAMNALRREMPSSGDSRLMNWLVYPQDITNPSAAVRRNNATDGCLDMAYALLLAHDQWGSNPAPGHFQNYMEQAQLVIQGLRASNMHPSPLYRTTLGDWQRGGSGSQEARTTTSRSSDWRPAHFRAFARAMRGDGPVNDAYTFWNRAADEVHNILDRVANPTTGLMPDFVTGNPARVVVESSQSPHPEALVHGEHNHHNFSFNACRVPWFLAMDYAHYGTARARTRLNTITNWLAGRTNSTPGSIWAGYTLAGDSIWYNINGSWTQWNRDLAFDAPFAAGMIATNNNTFLSSMYTHINSINPNNEYAAAIQLLNMLLITGNWWAPASEGVSAPTDFCEEPPMEFTTWETGWGRTAGPGATASYTANGEQVSFNLNRGVTGWASAWVAFSEGEFEFVNQIAITYTSTAPIRISLGHTVLAAGGATFKSEILPASATPRTVFLNPAFFEQEWDFCWDPDAEGFQFCGVENNLAEVNSIVIEAVEHGVATNGVITRLEVFGFGCSIPARPCVGEDCAPDPGGPIHTPPVSTRPTNAARMGSRGVSVSRGAINLNIPSERVVTLSINDVRGRMLFSQEVNLNAGRATLSVPSHINQSQTLILSIRGQNGFNASRRMFLAR